MKYIIALLCCVALANATGGSWVNDTRAYYHDINEDCFTCKIIVEQLTKIDDANQVERICDSISDYYSNCRYIALRHAEIFKQLIDAQLLRDYESFTSDGGESVQRLAGHTVCTLLGYCSTDAACQGRYPHAVEVQMTGNMRLPATVMQALHPSDLNYDASLRVYEGKIFVATDATLWKEAPIAYHANELSLVHFAPADALASAPTAQYYIVSKTPVEETTVASDGSLNGDVQMDAGTSAGAKDLYLAKFTRVATGTVEWRAVTNYVDATKILTITPFPLAVFLPGDIVEFYEVLSTGDGSGLAIQATPTNSGALDATAAEIDGAYDDYVFVDTSSTPGITSVLSDYVGASRFVQGDTALTAVAGNSYQILDRAPYLAARIGGYGNEILATGVSAITVDRDLTEDPTGHWFWDIPAREAVKISGWDGTTTINFATPLTSAPSMAGGGEYSVLEDAAFVEIGADTAKADLCDPDLCYEAGKTTLGKYVLPDARGFCESTLNEHCYGQCERNDEEDCGANCVCNSLGFCVPPAPFVPSPF